MSITIRTKDIPPRQESFDVPVDKTTVEDVFGLSGAYLKNNLETSVVSFAGVQAAQTYVVFGTPKARGKNNFFNIFFNMQSIFFTNSFKHSKRKYIYVIWT